MPAYSENAEACLLGCVIEAAPAQSSRLLEQLHARHFYDERHKLILDALRVLSKRKGGISADGLDTLLRKGRGAKPLADYAITLPAKVHSPAHWPAWMEECETFALKRDVIANLDDLRTKYDNGEVTRERLADYLAQAGNALRQDIGAESPAAALVPTVYDSGRRSWWTQNGRGSWIEVTETGIRRLLKSQGFSKEVGRNDCLSPLDAELLRLQRNDDVAFAGPLAGWSTGIHDIASGRILVTNEAALRWTNRVNRGVETTIEKIIWGMLGEKQTPILYSWLHVRRAALLKRVWTPGQVMALCGPAQCGKSLTQWIVTLLLGGREAKPWRYMTGATEFNGELFGAEHLVIEDEAASTDIRARRHFGAHLKSMLYARAQSCHAKNRQAVTLEPLWAMSVSVNDEPENLMVLPPLDESLLDKVILLRCERKPMPIDADTVAGQEQLRAAIQAELPAFAAMVDDYAIPAELGDERCGVKAYQHPDLLQALESLAPETRLLELIDQVVFREHPARVTWQGTSAELASELRQSTVYGYEAERLLHFRDACGTYLGRLAKRYKDRIERAVLHGHTRWTLHALARP